MKLTKIKTIMITTFMLILLTSLAAAEIGFCDLDVTLVNQDPYPATPDSYVKVVFQVSGTDDPTCDGAKFEIAPEFPFSLDGRSPKQELAGSTHITDYKKEWLVPYKLRIDEDALDGEAELKTYYAEGGENQPYQTQTFNITIEDSRTDFDLVVQEITEEDATIALANTGRNVAYSVIVRIPKQENFRTTGVSGQMVGNLEDGDYTLVSFGLQKISKDNDLQIQIDYTDEIGERRTIIKTIDYGQTGGTTNTAFSGTATTAAKNFRNNRAATLQTTQQPIYQKWWFWAIILSGLFIIWKSYSKYKEWQEKKEIEEHRKNKEEKENKKTKK